MRDIPIIIALEKGTNKLVNAKEVPSGKKCNCYCGNCNEDLVAINKEVIQKSHFRHSQDSKCLFKGNYESYIHWLTKEIFKRIDKLKLPPILLKDLNIKKSNEVIKKLKIHLTKKGILEEFPESEFGFDNICLQTSTEIEVKNSLMEKVYETSYGNIKVDIILKIRGQEFFIEPFLTSPIQDNKLKKLEALNISTISINLRNFIIENDHHFTLENFISYITNDINSKSWEFVRNSKAETLIENLFNDKFVLNLSKLYKNILKNREINKQIGEIEDKIFEFKKKHFNLSQDRIKINIRDLF